MRKFVLSLAAALTFISTAMALPKWKTPAEPSSDEYITFKESEPMRWDDITKGTFIWFNTDWRDKTNHNAFYYFNYGTKATFLFGRIHRTKDMYIFEYPEKIDLKGTDGKDGEREALLEYYFPAKSKCIWVCEKDLKYEFSKGFYRYKDSLFKAQNFTVALKDGETSQLGDNEIVIEKKMVTPVSRAWIYSKPSLDASKIFFNRVDWNIYNKDQGKKVQPVSRTYSAPAYNGMRFETQAKTTRIKGQDYFWYYVKLNVNENSAGVKNGWICSKDVESYDSAKTEKYAASLINLAVQDKLITVETIDKAKLPSDLKRIVIGEEDVITVFYNDTDKKIWSHTNWNNTMTVSDRTNLFTDDDGFTKFKFSGTTYLIIDGEIIRQSFGRFSYDSKTASNGSEQGQYHNYYFKDIQASSSYSEVLGGRRVDYTPDNLYKCFFVACRCHPYGWNRNHIPWVEGAAGNGIGESVTVEFTEPMKGMTVLNGYVDINRTKLYKENSRVKKLKVEDLENNKIQYMDFKDEVYFNYIAFSKPSSKVRITIEEVYQGTKYTDTCISAIIPTKDDPVTKKSAGEYFFEYYRVSEIISDSQ